MLTYEQAAKLFATARTPRRGKPLQNNTRLFQDGDDYTVRCHATDVVTLHPDGTYTLRTGGWHTMLTADRIRTYSPASVGNVKGTYSLHVWRANPRYTMPFSEGMRVDGEGYPLGDKIEGPLKIILAAAS